MGMRMTVTLDNRLVEEVKNVLGVSTKSEAIRIALHEVLRRRRLESALEHQGKMDLAIDPETLKAHRLEG